MRNLIISIMICISIGANAQDELSLNDLWQILSENNYSLKQQQKLIEVAEEDISISKTNQYPTISLGGYFRFQSELAELQLPFALPGSSPETIETGVKDQYDVSVSITQPIFTGFRTSSSIHAAQYKFDSQTIQKQVVQSQLALSIGNLYYQVQLNIFQRKALMESISRAGNQLKLIRNMMAADQATAFDTLEVSNRKLQIKSQIQKLEDLHVILISKIKFLINKEDLIELKSFEVTTIKLNLPDLQIVKNEALSHRLELQQINTLQKAFIFNKNVIKSAYYPQIYANASYHYAKPGVNFFQDQWMDYYTIGVNFQWELWNWGQNKSKVRQSEIHLEKLDLQKEQQKIDILQQVEEAFQNMKMTLTQIKLNKKLVEQEKERYRISEQKYQNGFATVFDLSNAEHSLTTAELELQKNYIAWFQNQLLLEFATGKIVPKMQGVSNE